LLDQGSAARLADRDPLQPGCLSDQRIPLELLPGRRRGGGDQPRRDCLLPAAVPCGRVVDIPNGLPPQKLTAKLSATLSGSKKRHVPRPSAFARYSAMSAQLSNLSRIAPSLGAIAMPIVTPIVTRCPLISYGALTTSITRRASTAASSGRFTW